MSCPVLFASVLLAALSSADAITTVLNSQSSASAKKFAEAKALVLREAEAGNPLQQFVVGVTSEDKELAKRFLDASRKRIYTLAAEKDEPIAWYLISLEKNDVKLLRRAADGGCVHALNALGTMAITEAFAQDRASNVVNNVSNRLEDVLHASYECFRKAAAQRDPNGFINLGTCYLRGFGCQQDFGMAFACFKAAAEAGHPEGMDNMSACYQFGHGVEKNSELSLFWGMRGRAARGSEAAAKWLEERK